MPWLQLTFHTHPDQAERLAEALNNLDADAVTTRRHR